MVRELGGAVYISNSGGVDSTVLSDLVHRVYPDVPDVFVDTGLEYPELREFIKSKPNVITLRPTMNFVEVIKKYGYPIGSKRISTYVETARRKPDSKRAKYLSGEARTKYITPGKWLPLTKTTFRVSGECCRVMKKDPMKKYKKDTGKVPIIATMAHESANREILWLKFGCNAYKASDPKSQPMSFWTEQDVLQYIKENNLPIASVYGEVKFENGKFSTTGCNRTGCIFCAFGCHLDKEPSRFQRLKETHPRQYEYCIGGGEYDQDGIWKPNKQGLGMGHVFDELNKIYGDGFIKY